MTDITTLDHSDVELVQYNASDQMVAHAAWVSNFNAGAPPVHIPAHKYIERHAALAEHYSRKTADTEYPTVAAYHKRINGLINFLYRERHMSPFEHGMFTFRIETPIFVAREFMRHRTASYNEASGRYKELEPKFFLISRDRPIVQSGKVGAYRFEMGTEEQYDIVEEETMRVYEVAWAGYKRMLNAGVAKEVARNVLPVGIMTQFYVTINPRNLMQFLMLRNDPNALEEIQEVAGKMENIFAELMPAVYSAYKKYDWREEKKELEEFRAQRESVKTPGVSVELRPSVEQFRRAAGRATGHRLR